MNLTPQMRGVLDRMARASFAPLHTLSPVEARAAYEAGAGVLEVARPALTRVEALTLPTRDGQSIRARLYAPSHERLPTLVYFHGGGFVIGSIDSHDVLCRSLSQLSGCAVVSVDYRLAPEHRFPVPVHDAWDALQWVAGEGARQGFGNGQLAVGGDSAGGTLAAVCALLARDANLPLAMQLLYYPGVAADTRAASHQRFGKGLVLESDQIDWFMDHYAPPAQRQDWRYAPLLAPDHDGVAPAWIGMAECDPLVDDGLAYADLLRRAGVPVDLEIYRGVTHEFIKMGRAIPEAGRAHADAARALRNAFARQTT